jgi:predicted dehydrogenase
MGKRRVRDLGSIDGVAEVRGFDPRDDRQAEAAAKFGVKTYGTMEDALAWKPDALIVSTPPDRHVEYAKTAVKEGCHFFVEASVIDDGLSELIRMMAGKKIVGVPSCTMRFHENVKLVREIVRSGDLGSEFVFAYHMGQYLPDWHPDEDYHRYYVSKPQTAATREMVCFELVWISWLLGLPLDVSCVSAKVTSLDLDAADVYQLILRFPGNCSGALTIDVVSRVPYRTLRMISEQGVIEWSGVQRHVSVYSAAAGKWKEYGRDEQAKRGGNFIGEEMYVDEMRAFVGAIRGTAEFPYDFETDREILAVLAAAEDSARSGQRVALGRAKDRKRAARR